MTTLGISNEFLIEVKTGNTEIFLNRFTSKKTIVALKAIGFTCCNGVTYVRKNNFKHKQQIKILKPINHQAILENAAGQDLEIKKVLKELSEHL